MWEVCYNEKGTSLLGSEVNKLPLQMAVVVMGPFRAKRNPKICKQTKFELSWTILASPRPVLHFVYQNKPPLQMALVAIGSRREKHNPKFCKQTKFELIGPPQSRTQFKNMQVDQI